MGSCYDVESVLCQPVNKDIGFTAGANAVCRGSPATYKSILSIQNLDKLCRGDLWLPDADALNTK